MDCEHVTELLPWYRNGTLDGAESADLERHLEGCEDCQGELRETEAVRLLFGGHPMAEMLVAYAAEDAAAPRDLVEAHLAGCASCAEELAMVLASRRAVDGAMAPAAAAEASAHARVVPLRRPAAPPPYWRAAAVAAALIGLIGIGGGLWSWRALEREQAAFAQRQEAAERRIAELEAEISSLDGARLNVPIHDLWPDGSLLRSADRPPPRLPAADGPAATLILNSQLPAGTALSRLEIRAGDGRLLHSLGGVMAGGSITLSLPLARLPAGELQILLFGPDATEPLETYTFELG